MSLTQSTEDIKVLTAKKTITLPAQAVIRVLIDNVEVPEFTYTVPMAKVARLNVLFSGTLSDS